MVALACTIAFAAMAQQPASAAVNLFLNFGGTNIWEDPNNWTAAALPTTADDAFIESGFTVTSSANNNVAFELQVGVGPNAYGNRGNPGGTGTLNILNGSNITTDGNLVVGQSQDPNVDSSGIVNIETGGTLIIKGANSLLGFFGDNNAGFNFPTSGTVNVNGGTFNWAGVNPNSTLWVGGDSNTNRVGKGVLAVSAGTASGGALRVGDYGIGTLNLTGGTLTSNWYMSVGLGNNPNTGHGEVNMSGGTLNVAELSINENKVEDCTFTQTGGTVNMGYTGTIGTYALRIGRSDKGKGIYNISGGELNVAGNDLWVEGRKEGVLNISGTAAVNVNSIAVPNRASDYALNVGGRDNGIATVNQTGGTVVIQPTSLLGLFFGGANGGTSTYNLSGGSLTLGDISPGNGSTAKIFNFNGGTLIANDTLIVPNPFITDASGFVTTISSGGANINTAGFSMTWTTPITGAGNLMKSGAGSLVLQGDNSYAGSTTVSGGVLLATNTSGSATGTGAVTVSSGAAIGGTGTVGGNTTISGTLAPGMVGATGSVAFGSTLTVNATSATELQLGGSSDFDHVAVTGAATLGGTLQLSLLNAYEPAQGQTHRVLDAGSVVGHFTMVAGNQLSSDRWLAVTYDATGVSVTAALPGDSDLSADVDFDDLLKLAQNYGLSDRVWATGDFNGSGITDFDDLLALAQHYGQSTLADVDVPANIAADWALAVSLVPEPTAGVGLLATALALKSRRRGANLG
jgi:autotransporter-associated beta strand protein